ncbi:MAG: riboflavin synthase [Alphaproteobacteria bacterium]|nr:riboflavin synthase [Alphaproteobacteria bacterium]
MFTGIIQSRGTVSSVENEGDRLFAISTRMSMSDVLIGASIACSGVCLTVIKKIKGGFMVQASMETLETTTACKWRVGTKLNLERALRLGDEIGGHLVLGHVDGVARVISKIDDNESVRYAFEFPQEFSRFLAPKGSITIDGVSLTINSASEVRAEVNVIPHTQRETTLGCLIAGDSVNFEVDMMARYIDRIISDGARKQ